MVKTSRTIWKTHKEPLQSAYAEQRFICAKITDRRNHSSQQRSEKPMFDWIENRRAVKGACITGLFFVLCLAMMLSASLSFAAVGTNKMVAMQVDSVEGNPALRIVTAEPVGYRYTVYDSSNPTRVVINFPHMDITTLSPFDDVTSSPVQKVDVTSYYLAGGRMARVEVVLSEKTDYDVAIVGNEFVLTLLRMTDQVSAAAAEPTPKATEPVVAPPSESTEDLKGASVVAPASAKELTASASHIVQVDVGSQVVTLRADGLVENYKYFSLVGPERLVVDVYGVKPSFEARQFPLREGFSGMRVGVYQEKLRVVFDTSRTFPAYAVTSNGESVVIRWGDGTSVAASPFQSAGQ